MSIVFGLCRLYLDCTIVFGLYDCIWIVQLYLDCTIAGFGTGGVVLPIPPPVPKICAKKDLIDCIWIVSIAFGLCILHVDFFDCLWINTRPEDDL